MKFMLSNDIQLCNNDASRYSSQILQWLMRIASKLVGGKIYDKFI
jgi:hypothetical protein